MSGIIGCMGCLTSGGLAACVMHGDVAYKQNSGTRFDRMETQCWICPYCFDDHGFKADCKQEDLRAIIEGLKETESELSEKLERAEKALDDIACAIQHKTVDECFDLTSTERQISAVLTRAHAERNR